MGAPVLNNMSYGIVQGNDDSEIHAFSVKSEIPETRNDPAYPWKVATGVLSVVAIGFMVATIAVASTNHEQTTVIVDPSASTSSVPDSELYTLAGFEVKVYYKCIFPTCTDMWCNANCNHHPKFCPANMCKKMTKKIPKPATTVAPTPLPTAQPTIAKVDVLCGLANDVASACAPGGRWYGKCGEKPGDAEHTYAEGQEVCNYKPHQPIPKLTCPNDGIQGNSWFNTKVEMVGSLYSLVCCPKECGSCAGHACGDRPGGKDNCCAQGIMPTKKMCTTNEP